MEDYSDFVLELRKEAEALNKLGWTGLANLVSRSSDIIEELNYKYKKAIVDNVKASRRREFNK